MEGGQILSSGYRVKRRYCCLGVACELYAKAVGMAEGFVDEGSDHLTFLGEENFLPSEVQDWLGIRNDRGEFRRLDGDRDDLTRLNDQGVNFEQIAQTIETHADQLFYPES